MQPKMGAGDEQQILTQQLAKLPKGRSNSADYREEQHLPPEYLLTGSQSEAALETQERLVIVGQDDSDQRKLDKRLATQGTVENLRISLSTSEKVVTGTGSASDQAKLTEGDPFAAYEKNKRRQDLQERSSTQPVEPIALKQQNSA